MEYLDWAFIFSAPLAMVGLLFLIKRRIGKNASAPSDELIEGTDLERKEEEERLKHSPLDIREQLLETMELQGRYPTRRGYSHASFDVLRKSLLEKGIASDVFFQPIGPLGFADSVIVQQGIIELYIERGKLEAARPLIELWDR